MIDVSIHIRPRMHLEVQRESLPLRSYTVVRLEGQQGEGASIFVPDDELDRIVTAFAEAVRLRDDRGI
jgi:hypothetical protein